MTNLATPLHFGAGLGEDGGVYIMVISLSVESSGSGVVSSFWIGVGWLSCGVFGLIRLTLIFSFLSLIIHCAFILA